MAIKKVFQAIVKGGKPQFADRDGFIKSFYAHEGKAVDITISRHSDKRSLSQNAYYHAVVVSLLADFLGYTEDEMHATLKAQFNSKEEVRDGKPLVRVKSTTDLSTVEFEDYIERIKRWASIEWSLYIPDPNEVEA